MSTTSRSPPAHLQDFDSPHWLCCKTTPNAVCESPCLKHNPLDKKICERCQHVRCEERMTHGGSEEGLCDPNPKSSGIRVGVINWLLREIIWL
ncbi:uncharacterized protein RSE6_01975 [Rhynchosporium secalis]|uniref:Uncharacterized protein n=1 Tax=Rhynchosporium secalis TaxID=38038 RepID=A0A1E1LZ49_RHYSE|nr:uncharacterized protein RSE6_01975 [Rhynchosporium secalis]